MDSNIYRLIKPYQSMTVYDAKTTMHGAGKCYKELKKSMIESYPEMAESFWREDQIELLLNKFPEGQLVIVVDGVVVGSALSILVTEEFAFKTRTYKGITGNFSFDTHNPDGEALYGIVA